MKTPALIFIALAVWGTASASKKKSKCFTWSEKRELQMMKMEMTCQEPTGQLVTLPVPDGFDYVTPSMKKVAMCSNMLCWGKNKICEPIETRNISIKVEAVKINEAMETLMPACTHVDVIEHLKCACGCAVKEKDCNERQVYHQQMCSCMCKKDLREKCSSNPMMMWQQNTCSCLCPEGAVCNQAD